jgi:hypothetical protein
MGDTITRVQPRMLLSRLTASEFSVVRCNEGLADTAFDLSSCVFHLRLGQRIPKRRLKLGQVDVDNMV